MKSHINKLRSLILNSLSTRPSYLNQMRSKSYHPIFRILPNQKPFIRDCFQFHDILNYLRVSRYLIRYIIKYSYHSDENKAPPGYSDIGTYCRYFAFRSILRGVKRKTTGPILELKHPRVIQSRATRYALNSEHSLSGFTYDCLASLCLLYHMFHGEF